MKVFVIHVKNAGKVPKNAHYEFCGRQSVFGNPEYMAGEWNRNRVCDAFDVYFPQALAVNLNGIRDAFDRLKEISLSKDVYLGCFCFPKRCHCNTIKRSLEGK